MNTQLKSKFANRFARFNRETQGIVLEFVDGSEDNISKIVNSLIDNGKIINLGIVDFE